MDLGNLPHPGVGSYGINSKDEIKRHAYYQWVPFVLFGQGIMFYLTHVFWKKLEGKSSTENYNVSIVVFP